MQVERNQKAGRRVVEVWREKTYKKMVRRTELFEIQLQFVKRKALKQLRKRLVEQRVEGEENKVTNLFLEQRLVSKSWKGWVQYINSEEHTLRKKSQVIYKQHLLTKAFGSLKLKRYRALLEQKIKARRLEDLK